MRDGMVFCPRRLSGMARDACVTCQAEEGCGARCAEGKEALVERIRFDRSEDLSDKVHAEVAERWRRHYQRWGRLPDGRSKHPNGGTRTGRPVGRPRAPIPGGTGPRR